LSRRKINLGKTGEEIATTYLRERGLQIVARNFRDKFGEIDIIARDRGTYVFVEVKTRRSNHFGTPEEAVTTQKQRQVIRVAQSYLAKHQLFDVPTRFDVVAILISSSDPRINHLVSAFDAG